MGKVLIVDDMPDNRRMFSEILDGIGYSYETATNAQEAVSKCSSQQFDLIFMDISIPMEKGRDTDMNGGIKAAKSILSLPKFRNTPIVAVTAHGMEAQKKAILNAGMKSIVEKGTERFIEEIEASLVRYVMPMANPLENEAITAKKTVLDLSKIFALQEAVAVNEHSSQLVSNDNAAREPVESINLSDSMELDAIYDSLVRAKDPRAAIGKVLSGAATESEKLLTSLLDLDREEAQIADARKLVKVLKDVTEKVRNPNLFAVEGSSLQHWIINLLVRAPGLLAKLDRQEACDFHRQLSNEIGPIQRMVNEVIRFAKEAHTFPDAGEPVHIRKKVEDFRVNSVEASDHFVANILIVDDSSDARLDLEEKIRRLRHRPFSCSNAEDALDMLSFRPFDVCLLDMQMPGVNGMEMIRRIRETARTSHLPIIVVSGSCHDSTGAEAIEMGANDFLTKPAVERLLQARINACLRQTLARKAELAKFLPEAVIESVLLDDSVLHIPRVEDITVMVCDIRGFSKISETRNPVETIQWISDVMNRLSDIILSQGGTIVDYVGDEIMAMWGAPAGSLAHPEEACKCAIMIQSEVAKLSIEWYPKLMTALEIGIGIHSGTAVCGNTGSKQRIKYGPLGNTVNLASRVQGATKYLHCSVLATSDTINRISSQMRGRRICKIRVQNLVKPVELYELVTESSEVYRDRIRPLNQYYEKALESFEEDDIPQALKRTAQILVNHPDDGPSKLLMLRVLQASLEQKFDPVWTMPGK